MRLRSVAALLIASASLLPSAFSRVSAAGQDQPRPTFRVGAEVVVVDLVATDGAGEFVRDLQPSEIQLTEDGKPQKVEFLRLVRTGERAAAPSAPAAPTASPEPATPATVKTPIPSTPEGALVILIDIGSMPIEGLPRVRAAIHALLKEDLPAGVPIVLATVSQTVKIGLITTDRAAMGAAVDALPAAPKPQRSLMDILEHLDLLCDTAGAATAGLNVAQTAISEGRALVTDNRQRLLMISEALTVLSRALSARPGRKQVVLYSAGYFVDATEDIIETLTAAVTACGATPAEAKRMMELRSRDRDGLAAMQRAIDRANRAQVSFYAVDPRGLFAPAPGADRRISAKLMRSDASRLAATFETRSQEYLRNMSAGTGGLSFVNNNDMARGLRRAWLDSSEYYLLGYVPSSARKKGEFHKIGLEINRRDISVRYRQGYYEATDHEIIEADISSALQHPDAYAEDGLRAEAKVANGALKVSALIPPARITFTQSGDTHQATFSIHAALRDAKGAIVGGKPLFGRDVSLNLKPDRFSALMASDTMEIPTDAKAPPAGTYQLTVVVRDSGGWLAARTVELVLH